MELVLWIDFRVVPVLRLEFFAAGWQTFHLGFHPCAVDQNVCRHSRTDMPKKGTEKLVYQTTTLVCFVREVAAVVVVVVVAAFLVIILVGCFTVVDCPLVTGGF